VQQRQQLVADFEAPPQGTVGSPVQFTDKSLGEPEEWSWDFGDETTSKEQNPSHTYTDPSSSYTVSLTVTRGSETRSVSKDISIISAAPKPTAHFTINNENPNCGELVTATWTNQNGVDKDQYYFEWFALDASPESKLDSTFYEFSYSSSGRHRVGLAVYDLPFQEGDEPINSQDRFVTVKDPSQDPTQGPPQKGGPPATC
jgi:hypothetical protein